MWKACVGKFFGFKHRFHELGFLEAHDNNPSYPVALQMCFAV
jgi:hypothetical protein